ncbi:hypothetical protein [Tsukamurella sp. 1534]|uniref:hypothetical protein n=1 Tax=Tsukamurella sp. 1534 TaxID=1151061 RepID=UPI0002DD0DF0|nr:hypothetical protein [Tsukamurella sp. 1534]
MTGPDPTGFDWFGFEDAVFEELRTVARALVYQSDGELPYAYALTGLHAEPSGPVDLPYPALGTVESVDPRRLWEPPAWPRRDDGWALRAPLDGWQDRLNAAVDGLDEGAWAAAHGRYGHALLGAVRRAGAELVAEGTLPTEVVVLVDDGADLAAKSSRPQRLRGYWAARAE